MTTKGKSSISKKRKNTLAKLNCCARIMMACNNGNSGSMVWAMHERASKIMYELMGGSFSKDLDAHVCTYNMEDED